MSNAISVQDVKKVQQSNLEVVKHHALGNAFMITLKFV